MRTKLSEFQLAMNVCTYDIVVLVETWLSAKYSDAELGLKGFLTYRCDRSSATSSNLRGGGVLIAVRKDIKSGVISINESTVEQVFVLVSCGARNVVLGSVYIPPKSTREIYETHCTTVMDIAERFCNNVFLICGDFNLPDATWTNQVNGTSTQCSPTSAANIVCGYYNYLNMMQENFIPNPNGNFLDLVFSNSQGTNVSVAIETISGTSLHHLAYSISLPSMIVNDNLNVDIVYYDFKNCNYCAMNEFLAGVQWDSVLNSNDVNVCVEKLYHILYDVIAFFVPVKRFKTTNFPVWFSRDLRSLVIQKKIAHRAYKESQSRESYEVFSILRDRCKHLQSECYRNYLNHTEDSLSNNPRFFWKHVNNYRQSNEYPNSMFFGECVAENGSDIVDLFAEHFSEVYANESHDLHDVTVDR